jgi:hypothetical protein
VETRGDSAERSGFFFCDVTYVSQRYFDSLSASEGGSNWYESRIRCMVIASTRYFDSLSAVKGGVIFF